MAFDPNVPVEIVFESYNLGSATWEAPILSLIEKFETEYPNVDVIPQASGDSTAAGGSAASVQRQVIAGNPPDVAQMTFDTLRYTVSDLQAQPLNTLFGQDALDEHYEGEYPMHDKVRGFGVVDGSTYGIPYVLSTPILWYNATALADAGIDDPDFSTWESLADIAARVSAKTGAPSFGNSCLDAIGEWCYQSMVRSADGRVLDEDDSTITVGEPNAVDPLITMQEINESGALQNGDYYDQYEAFAAATTQIHINSASLQSAFQKGADAGGWELAAAPMPGVEGKDVVPTSSGSMLSIFTKDPAKQAAAWELTKFMTSPAAYEVITPQIGYLPLRTSMTEEGGPLAEWAAEQADLLAPNIEQLDSIEPWVAYPGKNYQQIATIITDAIEQVVYQGADPEATMSAAAARAQTLVEQ
ncbi:extracellular solute-binding protein [Rhodococcus sp. 114MFTsu3.1]|uniref:extracellular solute-binding protein n=1 Tax=Rhodococcus sp. 114MFTsu3.1 TaxID=1172184 RepID=UPI001E284428|nr:extracellular solute-binding protein [Rhodococcus sp. 114MFTsu3.1]